MQWVHFQCHCGRAVRAGDSPRDSARGCKRTQRRRVQARELLHQPAGSSVVLEAMGPPRGPVGGLWVPSPEDQWGGCGPPPQRSRRCAGCRGVTWETSAPALLPFTLSVCRTTGASQVADGGCRVFCVAEASGMFVWLRGVPSASCRDVSPWNLFPSGFLGS